MSIVEGSVLAKKENSAFLEAYGSWDKNSVRKAVRRRKLWCMLKKYLTGFNEVIEIKEKKMAYETKCQILIVNKKKRLVQIKDHVKKINEKTKN